MNKQELWVARAFLEKCWMRSHPTQPARFSDVQRGLIALEEAMGRGHLGRREFRQLQAALEHPLAGKARDVLDVSYRLGQLSQPRYLEILSTLLLLLEVV